MTPGVLNSHWMVARERRDALFVAAEIARLARLAAGDPETGLVFAGIGARIRRVLASLPGALWPHPARTRLFGPRDGLA
jgi:hypothetical protein